MNLKANPPLYIEILIDGPMDELWEKTQSPSLHEMWDLRFTEITYLPRESAAEPQRFLYATRIGFGLSIRGEGESVGEKLEGGNRTSALRFWSDHPLSLIAEGSGYWKYIHLNNGRVRFLTWYDYRTRFGMTGQLFDRWVFRPLIGWATAWSFDALRLWIEEGVDPRLSRLRLLTDGFCAAGLAGAWIYQGVIPKLLFPSTGEREILLQSGFEPSTVDIMLPLIGVGQILFGLCLLLVSRRRLLYQTNLILLSMLAVGALVSVPAIFIQPFNPASLTIAMAALALAGLVAATGDRMPSARRCRRTPPRKKH